MPWDALRLRDGRYVVERYAIGIATSAEDAFFGKLARGKRVIEALRSAKLAMMSAKLAMMSAKLARMKEGARPRVWAAFNVVGDPMVRVPLRAPRSRAVWWVGAGGWS